MAALTCVPSALGAPPSNDDFAAAAALGGDTGSWTGTNAEATKEADEPAHAGNAGGASVWFTWTAPRTGVLVLDTCEADFDTLLAIYTGDQLNALTSVDANDNACNEQSGLDVDVVAGTQYRIAVDGAGGATGAFVLWWGIEPANDDFAAAAAISGPEGSVQGNTHAASHEAGEPLHAAAPGTGSVWYRWTAPATGRARIDSCLPGNDTLLAVYTGSAVNALTTIAEDDDGCGGLGSLVYFDATGGTVYSIAVDGFDSQVAFTLQWSLGPLMPRNLSPPVISGPAVENGVMSATTGTWVHATSYSYQWYHCVPGPHVIGSCTRISREQEPQLTVPTAALGRVIRVSVVGYGPHGNLGVFSEPSPVVGLGPPVNDAPPSIVSGYAKVGQTLRSSEGTWRLGSAPRQSLTYLWQRCNAAGAGCVGVKGPGGDAGYRLTSADLGSTIRVVVAVTTAGGSASAASPVTETITLAARAPRKRTCVVPRLVGKTVASARRVLRASRCRFRVGRARRAWSARKTGRIIRQTPRAGRRLAAGARVHVVVSKGRRR
jgi:hypothetical protein